MNEEMSVAIICALIFKERSDYENGSALGVNLVPNLLNS